MAPIPPCSYNHPQSGVIGQKKADAWLQEHVVVDSIDLIGLALPSARATDARKSPLRSSQSDDLQIGVKPHACLVSNRTLLRAHRLDILR